MVVATGSTCCEKQLKSASRDLPDIIKEVTCNNCRKVWSVVRNEHGIHVGWEELT